MKTSDKLYNNGIEIMKLTCPEVDILVLSDLYRLEPTEYALGGKLGADVWFDGIKTFIGYSEMEDIIIYGEHIARELIYLILNKNYHG